MGTGGRRWAGGHFIDATVDDTLRVIGHISLHDSDYIDYGSSGDVRAAYSAGTNRLLYQFRSSEVNAIAFLDNLTTRHQFSKDGTALIDGGSRSATSQSARMMF